jgi:hypothetical protein
MGAVIFSDVHADAMAISALASCIKKTAFTDHFGSIDCVVNLGDILHRGNHPREALEHVHMLAKKYRLISVMGNHDHAFLNGIPVSGSDAVSSYRHEQVRGSPLLSLFTGMPMEWVHDDMLFVHGGPLDLGSSTLRLKCWQRLGKEAGDFFTGYHYTPEMAFSVLRSRGLNYMCCGHQHSPICCQKTPDGIKNHDLVFSGINDAKKDLDHVRVAEVPLDMPTILRIGSCYSENPEFAYTDFKRFSFIRII